MNKLLIILALIIGAGMASAENLPSNGQIQFLESQGLNHSEAVEYNQLSSHIIHHLDLEIKADVGETNNFVRDLQSAVHQITGSWLNNNAHERLELVRETDSNSDEYIIEWELHNLQRQIEPVAEDVLHKVEYVVDHIFNIF